MFKGEDYAKKGPFEIVTDTQKSVTTIYVQNHHSELKPTIVHIDGTYRTNSSGFALYLLCAQNSNCNTETLAFGLLKGETASNLEEFLALFKKNFHCNTVKKFITDKDFGEINAIKSIFPESEIILCYFHNIQSIEQKIAGLAFNTKISIRDLFKAMSETRSDQKFEQYYV